MNSKGADASQAEGPSEFSRHILSCFWWRDNPRSSVSAQPITLPFLVGYVKPVAKSRLVLCNLMTEACQAPCPPLSPATCSAKIQWAIPVCVGQSMTLSLQSQIYIYVFPLYQKSASLQVFSSVSSLAIIPDAFVQIPLECSELT